MARLLVLMLLAAPAWSQVAITVVNGTTEATLSSTVDFGKVAVSDAKDQRFRARNTGKAAATVSTINVNGAGFALTERPTLPYVLAPGSTFDFTVRFSPTIAATYSATLAVGSVNALLIGSATRTTSITKATGCTFDGTRIAYSNIEALETATCTLTLDATPSSSSVSGASFRLASNGASLTLSFQGQSAGFYTGQLSVDLRTYPISAAATPPTLAKPSLQLDAGVVRSNLQTRLTISSPSPAKADASGSITLAFEPDPSTTIDDKSVLFLATGARKLPVTIKAGSTQYTINGQSSAVLQTGTTAGRITLTLSMDSPLAGDPTVQYTLAPQSVSIDTSAASRRSGALDLSFTGYDNTYSAGQVSFTFYDATGKALDPITADFRKDFQSYLAASTTGSAFLMRITFPVTGDASLIKSVDVQLINKAGTLALPRLTFPD